MVKGNYMVKGIADGIKVADQLTLKYGTSALLVCLSGLSGGLQTKGSLVQFPVRAHAWVVGQIPNMGHTRDNHTLMFLSLSFCLPSPLLKRNKIFKNTYMVDHQGEFSVSQTILKMEEGRRKIGA